MVLDKSGKISGTVTLQNQSDHTGIMVYIPGTTFIAMSDSDGKFVIEGVPGGNYEYIRAEKDGYRVFVAEDFQTESDGTVNLGPEELKIFIGEPGKILINQAAESTGFTNVYLNITAAEASILMWVSEDPLFLSGNWELVKTEMEWDFGEEGEKAIYVKFADANGLESPIRSDTILIDSSIATANLVCNYNDTATKLNSGCTFK